MRREIRLPLTAEGRLDRMLADQLGVGRASVKRAFLLGEVRVHGRRVRASEPATPGALVEIEVEDPAGPPRPDSEQPLTVLAQSTRWLVVDKPSGMATHPLHDQEGGTLANAVAARHPECAQASPDPREGGAVHRLDQETSGCVLFARDRRAWEKLHQQLVERRVEKVYRALVVGRMITGGVCSIPLAQRGGRVVPVPDELAADRLSKKAGRPRPAETRWEIERSTARHTLLSVVIITGVMHQIRAHLAYLGFPVVGDRLYGGAAVEVPGWQRHFLHAVRLGFEAPEGGRVVAESPLPPDLVAFLEQVAAEA
jgi:23S rRNA pseudouridine1911/1915/1917 synthase